MRYKVIFGEQVYYCRDIEAANELYMSYFLKHGKLELWDTKLNKKLCWKVDK